tara:strand:- start:3870 stop:4163 length:294 start_codon:yes stop_codon:yes gene_type:complete
MKKIKTVRKNSQVYKWITEVINLHEKYQKSYYWKPPTIASQRRRLEFENSFTFDLNGVIYQIDQSLELSCKNYYYSLNVYVNCTKKNIRSIKKLIGA